MPRDNINLLVWAYPKWAQIRFCSYAPTSGEPIDNKQILERKKVEIEHAYQDKTLPISEEYCGICVKPKRAIFYTYRLDELSDVLQYEKKEKNQINVIDLV